MSKASLFKYYIRIIMAVQYDSEKGLITWLDLLEKQVPEISTQVKELLDLFNDNSLHGLNNSELKEFFDGLDGADEDFLKFIDTVDSSENVFNQYQQYLIQSGKINLNLHHLHQKS